MREIGATVATNSPEGALYFFYCRRCIDYVRRLSRAKQCRFCTEVEERLQDPRKLTRYTWLATGDVPAITVPPDVCPEPTPELIGWLLFRWGKPEGSDDGLCSVCHRVNWEGWFLQWSPFGAALWGFCDDCAGMRAVNGGGMRFRWGDPEPLADDAHLKRFGMQEVSANEC
jgi:hypothetical protein